MNKVNSIGKTILYITAFIWTACIFIMGTILMDYWNDKLKSFEEQEASLTVDTGGPRAISIFDKANTPFDMPYINFERTAACKFNVSPDKRIVYININKDSLEYCDILTKADKTGIITARYYKGVGCG